MRGGRLRCLARRASRRTCARHAWPGGRTATWDGRSSSPGRASAGPAVTGPARCPAARARAGRRTGCAAPIRGSGNAIPGLPLGQWLARNGRAAAALVRHLHRGFVRGGGGQAGKGCATRITRRGAAAAAGTPAPPWPSGRVTPARPAPPRTPSCCAGCPSGSSRSCWPGVQRRTDAGLRTRPDTLRCLVNLLHARRAASVLDLAAVPSTSIRHYAGALLRSLLAELHCALSDPEPRAGQGRVAAGRARASRHAGLHRARPAVAARGSQALGRGRPAAAPRPAGRLDGPGHHQRPGRAVAVPAPCPATTAATIPPCWAGPTSSRSPAGWRTCSAPGR